FEHTYAQFWILQAGSSLQLFIICARGYELLDLCDTLLTRLGKVGKDRALCHKNRLPDVLGSLTQNSFLALVIRSSAHTHFRLKQNALAIGSARQSFVEVF